MKRTRSWILAGLVLAMPPLAHADDVDVPAYTAVPPCHELSGEPVIGTVVAMSGPVSIGSPGCAPAAAECGSALHAGQHLITGSGASVGLLAGDRYVQIVEGSRVAVATTDAGVMRVAVEEGTARVIDVGPAGATSPVEVTTPKLASSDPGADVVAAARAGPGLDLLVRRPDPGASGRSRDVGAGRRLRRILDGTECAAGGDAGPDGPRRAHVGPLGAAALDRWRRALRRRCGRSRRVQRRERPGHGAAAAESRAASAAGLLRGWLLLAEPAAAAAAVGLLPGGIGEQPVIFEPPPD